MGHGPSRGLLLEAAGAFTVNPSKPENGRDPSKPKCAAHRSTDGQPCGNPPTPGGPTCRYHGGKAPQVQRKAAERATEAAVRKALAQYNPDGTYDVDDPLTALLALAGEILAFKTYLGELVAGLRAADWRYDVHLGEQLRGEVILYERALDRAAKVLVDINRLGLEERLVRLNERQGSLITTVIERFLEALGLPPAEHHRALRLLPPILREVGNQGKDPA